MINACLAVPPAMILVGTDFGPQSDFSMVGAFFLARSFCAALTALLACSSVIAPAIGAMGGGVTGGATGG